MGEEENALRLIYEPSDAPYLPNYRFDNGKEADDSAWNEFKAFVMGNTELLSVEIGDPMSFQLGLQRAFALTRLFLSDAVTSE